MRKIELTREKLVLSEGIQGFLMKKVTKFGTGAKVDCPKEFLGKTVYLVVVENGVETPEGIGKK
jgi:putative transposon-encoded protein